MFNKSGYLVLALTLSLALLLTGCGGFSLWPFGSGAKAEAPGYKPQNATEFLCDAGKKFYVRNIENGAAVWLILPERELALNRSVNSQSPTRYSNGITTLEIIGTDATLDINATTSFKGCKQAEVKPSK